MRTALVVVVSFLILAGCVRPELPASEGGTVSVSLVRAPPPEPTLGPADAFMLEAAVADGGTFFADEQGRLSPTLIVRPEENVTIFVSPGESPHGIEIQGGSAGAVRDREETNVTFTVAPDARELRYFCPIHPATMAGAIWVATGPLPAATHRAYAGIGPDALEPASVAVANDTILSLRARTMYDVQLSFPQGEHAPIVVDTRDPVDLHLEGKGTLRVRVATRGAAEGIESHEFPPYEAQIRVS